jgi:hypothetical protein
MITARVAAVLVALTSVLVIGSQLAASGGRGDRPSSERAVDADAPVPSSTTLPATDAATAIDSFAVPAPPVESTAGAGTAAARSGRGGQGTDVAGSGGGHGPAWAGTADPSCRIFPADNSWNTLVTGLPVHANSGAFISSMGSRGLHPDFGTVWDGAPNGIPYVEVGAGQPRVPVAFDYADESDAGPYPVPADAPIEGGPWGDGDRHVLVVDRESCHLWELFDAHPQDGGAWWTAGSGASWDLRSNALRPDTWTSADAAGLPIFPGLVRYDEVASGRIDHALRFTVRRTQRGFIHPATHFASSNTDPDVPPMGLRVRLRPDFACGTLGEQARVICVAMQEYGMLLADNGSDWYVSGAPDPRWDDDALHDLGRIPGSAFEAVDTGPVLTG